MTAPVFKGLVDLQPILSQKPALAQCCFLDALGNEQELGDEPMEALTRKPTAALLCLNDKRCIDKLNREIASQARDNALMRDPSLSVCAR